MVDSRKAERWKLADMIQLCNKDWVKNFRLDQSIEENDTDAIIAIVNVSLVT